MSDVISRQVAISAICSACGKIDCDKMDKCEKLQLPPANNSEIPNSSDTISRTKAIDGKICIRRSNGVEIYDDYVVPVEYLKQLPPAQPNVHDLAKDADCISRQAAITALSNEIVKRRLLDEMYDGCIDEFQTEEILKKLPPAQPAPSQVAADISRIVENGQDMRVIGQPERIKGHWVNGRCDKCNEHAPFWAMASTYYASNFCSNCGSDNREETE